VADNGDVPFNGDPRAIIAEMYTDIKWIKNEIKAIKAETKEELKKHANDIEDLKRFKHMVVGALTVIYILIGWLLMMR